MSIFFQDSEHCFLKEKEKKKQYKSIKVAFPGLQLFYFADSEWTKIPATFYL